MKTEQKLAAAGGKAAIIAAAAKAQWLAQHLKPGELYAGIILGLDGEQDHHLILLPGEATKATWQQARTFAADLGGELPTRREQALLYANLKREFQPDWYWSGEQHAAYDVFAWCQDFDYGSQTSFYKSASLRARAVRRLTIQ